MKRPISLPKMFFSIALLFAILPGGAGATPTSDVIERFHANLLSVMKEARTLGLQGRYSRLEPEIEQAFNLTLMVRIATGSFWKKANEAQRKDLLSSFKRISVSTYASQFNSFSGQSFRTLGEKPGPQKTQLVETQIMRPPKAPVKITYVMKGDRIIDVLLDNSISELAVRRSEYRYILSDSGIPGLINVLNEKANKLIQE
ncbi:MAG TPA: toluene tolerance protein [Rhodospirillales bacterium]|nr:toluene tolerance protein [Rhodospirillales bacterium]